MSPTFTERQIAAQQAEQSFAEQLDSPEPITSNELEELKLSEEAAQYSQYFGTQPQDIQDFLLEKEAIGEYYEDAVRQFKKREKAHNNELKSLLSRFKTVKELFADGQEETKWIVPRFIPAKALVSFQGRAKSGKSTLVFHMLKALIDGTEFLGQKLEQGKVVYLSEQPRSVFKGQLQEAGINEQSENLSVLTVEDNHGLDWNKTFELAMLKLQHENAKLLIVDSWGRFAGFQPGEDEMSPAPTQRRITSLRGLMADTDATVFIIQHVSKATDRGLIDSGMGSSALAQQVDLALSLSGDPARKEIQSNRLLNSNCRAIQGKGRYSDAITEPFAVELKDGSFIQSEFKESEGDSDDAVSFLSAQLADGQPHPSNDILSSAKTAGIGKNTLWDAKKQLNISATKIGSSWHWQMSTIPQVS